MRILCLDVGAATIQFGVMEDGRETFCERSEMPTRGREGAEAVLARLVKIIDRYAGSIDCISICTRGRIDEEKSEIVLSTDDIPGWGGFPLVPRLKERFAPLPIVIVNDSTALALGEAHFGSMRGQEGFLCLNIGAGIGGVVMHGGRVQWLRSRRAPEMGHIMLHSGGKRCSCGQLGCFEAYASAHALIRMAACRLRRRTLTGRELFCLVEKGDAVAQECLENWAHEVALGLYNICCVVNPDAVVLGGGIMQQRAALEAVRRKMEALPCMQEIKPACIRASSLGSAAGLYGCVVAARQKLAKKAAVSE